MSALSPKHFINRELSWLAFNSRVLDEALDRTTPLLERLKFFCIFSSNLDEFFEVRVAGIKQQVEGGVTDLSMDGLNPAEIFHAVTRRVRQLVEQQYRCWRDELVPGLEENGFAFVQPSELTCDDKLWVEKFYFEQVRPVLTPLAIDPSHPFPQLLNKSLNLIVELEFSKDGSPRKHIAVVQVPRVLPRLVPLPRTDGKRKYALLGQIIGHYLADLFPGTKILGFWNFRVTRNSELYIDEEEAANLLRAVENELHNRRKGDAVRLEVERDCPIETRSFLLTHLRLTDEDLYVIDGPLNPTRLMMLCEGDHSPELRYPSFVPTTAARLHGRGDFFEVIREGDVLLHHPYESFGSLVEFLEQSADDPDVLAIKQTLYRTGGDPRIVGALMNAVRNGKQVTAVVELRARFDEANNILWARRLEEAGVHVVYGLVGYKIHAKVTLVVRKEPDRIRRYVHLSTGNYNPTTSKIYTDIGILTCHPDFGEDATNLFNLLTGICQFQSTKKFIVAPFQLHGRIRELIEREATNARKGIPARIIAKMNALVDPEIIQALYLASQAGVRIDLLVRGICCLRPQQKGLSENITVRSIVDRFLEHSRVFYFENSCQPELFVASADWMPRNFQRRIEVVWPIVDGNIRDRMIHELLETMEKDNVKARYLKSDGTYRLPSPSKGSPFRSQFEFVELAQKSVRQTQTRITPKGKYPSMKLRKRPGTTSGASKKT